MFGNGHRLLSTRLDDVQTRGPAEGFRAGRYFANAELVRGLEEIDLAIHPPPELVIEIDITSDSMNKLPIFAAAGVAEVWRYSRSQVEIFVLDGPAYRSADRSSALPALTATAIAQLVSRAVA